MIKYKAVIQSIGDFAQEFVDEGILVFFGLTAPEELQETSFVHDCSDTPTAPVVAGDQVLLDNTSFKVLSVGTVANENLKSIGHIVLKFNGLHEPEMQGDITLPERPIPKLNKGSTLVIKGRWKIKFWLSTRKGT